MLGKKQACPSATAASQEQYRWQKGQKLALHRHTEHLLASWTAEFSKC